MNAPFTDFFVPCVEGRLCYRLSHVAESSDEPNSLNYQLFVLSYIALLSDFGEAFGPSFLKPRSELIKFIKILGKPTLARTIKSYAQAADFLLRSQYHDIDFERIVSTDEDRDCLRTIYRSPVGYAFSRWRCSRTPEQPFGNSALFARIIEFLLFGKKMIWVDPTLEDKSLADWFSVEERLTNLQLKDDVLEHLKHVVAQCLPKPATLVFLPRNGPGGVADTSRRLSSKVLQGFKYYPDIDRAFFGTVRSDIKLDNFDVDIMPYGPEWRSREIGETVSRFIVVPKDIGSARSICSEPTTLMYFQQAVRRWMEDAMRHGVLRRYVTIHDQSRNRILARLGSMYGNSDTIDLKSASDSVSWDLIRRIMPDWLLPYLSSTRSDKVKLPDGRLYGVRKFAPMGSAVCFPTQTVVYSAITILAYAHYISRRTGVPIPELIGTDTPGDRFMSILKKARLYTENGVRNENLPIINFIGRSSRRLGNLATFAVYGDDIILDTRITPIVTSLLTELGFVVNLNKSFVKGQAVRESCGGYYIAGQDITPLRFRVKPDTEKRLVSLIDFINRAGDRRYRNLHRVLITYAKRSYPGLVFTSDRTGGGVFSARCPSKDGVLVLNRHLKSRWDPELQRSLVRGQFVTSKVDATTIDLYHTWPLQRHLYNSWCTAASLRRIGTDTLLEQRLAHLSTRSSVSITVNRYGTVVKSQPYGDVSHSTLSWRWTPNSP